MASTRPACAPQRRSNRILSLATLVIAALAAPLALTARSEDTPPATQPADTADAATKQLIAAHGLFQRGLFRLAAQGYADFLSEHPDHPQRTAALYALAICEYRQAEYDKAA